MTSNNEKDRGSSQRFAPGGGPEGDQLVEETERLLANTRAFLDSLEQGEEATRKYVEEVKESFENDLRRLKRDRRERDKED
jgi:hypothetical protein